MRRGAVFVATLEARIAHQPLAGSAIVVGLLEELGVSRDQMEVAEQTRSTREEVRAGAALIERRECDRLVAITSLYHVPRVRRYLGEHLPPGQYTVYSPESYYRDADPTERAWIDAGAPTPETLRQEGRVERRWLLLASVARLLPAPLRFDLEAGVAQLYAAWGDRP